MLLNLTYVPVTIKSDTGQFDNKDITVPLSDII